MSHSEPAEGFVRYPSYSFHRAHPDRLSGLAKLFGLEPADVKTCRVLDIGCASAGHLIPMAARLPEASFEGLDIVEEEIARGQELADAMSLSNLTLSVGDLRDTEAWSGPYDYIIAHGMYSWLPEPLQASLLEGIRASLAPGGIAYVSWNVLPGWYRRAPLRELVQAFVPADLQGSQRVQMGRGLAEALGDLVPDNGSAWSKMVLEELDRLDEAHDGFFLGDVATPCMEPLRFDVFHQRVSQAGLALLCDAEALNPGITGPMHPAVRSAIDAVGPDLVGVEGFLDIVEGRPFRASLLVRDDEAIDRGTAPESMRKALYSSDLAPPEAFTPGQPATFRSPWGGSARVNVPILQLILDALSRRWPERLSLEELCEDIGVLTGNPVPDDYVPEVAMALRLCVGSNMVEPQTRPLPPRGEPGPSPTACPVVRATASLGETRVPNDHHRAVPLHPIDQQVLPMLDGTLSIDALTQWLQEHTTEDDRVDAELPKEAPAAAHTLARRYARQGLLTP